MKKQENKKGGNYNGLIKLDTKFPEMRDYDKIRIYENTTKIYTSRKSSSSFICS